MRCPRCGSEKSNRERVRCADRSITYRRNCPSGHEFATVEKIVTSVEREPKKRPAQDKGVRFDVLIGDDEPGARG